MGDELEVRSAYDGSSTAYRVLEASGWDELVNLGYYPWSTLAGIALGIGLGPYQRGLVRRSLALLDARPGERVLDAACGRGYSTAQLARAGCEALGLDLLEENIARARTTYAAEPRARFAVADVTQLPARAAGIELAPDSFDRVHCLEAGFHFGPRGRLAFLGECIRVLRPGGRLVLVDFVWRDTRPEAIDALDPRRLVRNTWRFAEFEPLERYRERARRVGFRETALVDWTGPVINRFQLVASLSARLGSYRAGQRALTLIRGSFARISTHDWEEIVELMRAHDAVRRASRYVALVLEKPAHA